MTRSLNKYDIDYRGSISTGYSPKLPTINLPKINININSEELSHMNMIDSAVATNATNFYWNTSSNSDCCTNSNIIVTDPISTAVRYIPE